MIAFEGRAVTEPQLTRKVDATGHENKLPVAPCLRAWEPPRVCFLQVELGYELGQDSSVYSGTQVRLRLRGRSIRSLAYK